VGRRVVVVGDASLGLGEKLLELGARTVHVYDSESERAASQPSARGLVVRPLPAAEFDVRDGAFDVAIVLDLSAHRPCEDLLLRVRRLLAKGGVALIGIEAPPEPRPASLDYYELYDLVALQFSHVRMIAEVPFAGVALADLGVEGSAPEVSVDTQLAGEAEAPERFFALASQEDVRLAEYAIIQLPADLAGPPTAPQIQAQRDYESRDSAARAELAQSQLRASLLEAQVDELRVRVSRQAESAEQAERARELDAQLAEESARLRDAEARAADHFARAERFSHEARDVGTELSRERDRSTALEGALVGAEAAVVELRRRVAECDELLLTRDAELRGVLTELEVVRASTLGAGEAELSRFAAVEARAASLDAEVARVAEEHGAEISELERVLQERARVVLELEQEVARRERIVRELLGSLEEARSEGAEATADPAAEDGGSLVAQRELDLAKMELAAVRRDVEARGASAATANERAAALAAANDELRARLDSLALELARREGERQEIGWRVAELEHQISRLEAEQTELTVTLPPPPMGKPRREEGIAAERVSALEGELDVLRQAMAQEHEARVRAESGDELTAARAELARQAVLLEQLSRELDARDRARQSEAKGTAASEA